MASYDDIQSLHSQITTEINSLLSKVETYGLAAQTAAMSVITFSSKTKLPIPSIDIKPFNSDSDFGAEFNLEYQSMIDRLGPQFKSMMDAFITQFFPTCSYDAALEWLCNTIKNGGTGIPAAVEDQIYQRARDRETREVSRLEDEAMNAMSSRGWAIPHGAVNAMVLNIQQEASNKVSSISRDIMIKQVEVEIENIKFAVSQSLDLRKSLWGALFDYLRSYFGMEGLAHAKASSYTDAKKNLYDNTYKYYDSLIRAEALYASVREKNLEADLTQDKYVLDHTIASTRSRTEAALGVAHSFAETAKGLASARNTLSALGDFTTKTA